MDRKPNIIVITIEHLPARALGVYGNPVGSTPELDNLAAKGARFENCTVPCPLCVPSRVAFFNGQYPSVTGCRDNTRLTPAEGSRHLPGLLTKNGYRCGLFGKNHCFSDPYVAGFETFHDEGKVKRELRERYGRPFPEPPLTIDKEVLNTKTRRFKWGSYPDPIWSGGEFPFSSEESPSRLNVDAALEFIEACDGDSFFSWVSFMDAHPAYRAPTDFLDLYDPQKMILPDRLENELDTKPFVQQVYYHGGWLDLMDESQLRQTMAYYYAQVSYVDNCLGILFRRLEELGIADNTVIIATGDHGEYLGEHGMIRKTAAFYDCLVQVPLITMNLPGTTPGQVITHQTEQIDVYPALLDVAGIETPSGTQGVSLSRVLSGELEPRTSTFSEVGSTEPLPKGGAEAELGFLLAGEDRVEPIDDLPLVESGTFFLSRGRMIRTKKWKYTSYVNDRSELYDLQSDPGELSNLSGNREYHEVEADLQSQLLARTIVAGDPR